MVTGGGNVFGTGQPEPSTGPDVPSGVSNGSISQEVIEKHEEETCRAILLELGNACHRRAIGLKPFVGES